MTTIIDVTKAWQGTEATVLESVLNVVSALGETVEVTAFARQAPALTQLATTHGLSVTTVEDFESEPAVAATITAAIAEKLHAGDNICVYSFSPGVRAAVMAWSMRTPGRVVYAPLNPFSPVRPEGSVVSTAWDAAFMREEEATRHLIEAIASTRTPSVAQVNLRTLLQVRDPRFSKVSGGFAATPRFISLLIDLGRARGLIVTTGTHPRTYVSLTENGRLAVQEAQSATQASAPVSASATAALVSPTLSAQFVAALRSDGLGPFMQVRVEVYEEIDRLVGVDSPVELKRLVGDAIKVTRESGRSNVPPTFPWSRVRAFIEGLMRRRPVAISAGELVALDWSNGASPVDSMLDNWQIRLDGVLVLHLLDKGIEIRMHDLPDLAGALYNGRDTSEMDRAFEVVATLARDGLIEDALPDSPLRRRHQQAPLVVAPLEEGLAAEEEDVG